MDFNNMDFNNMAFGIDFGTSQSTISVWYKNEVIIIQDINGLNTIPTVIEFIDNNKKIIGNINFVDEFFIKPSEDPFLWYPKKNSL